MAQTFKRVCIEDYTITDGDDSFTLHRAQEYLTSPERDGQVRVFSQYWVWVPSRIFAGPLEFTAACQAPCVACGR